LFCHDFQLAPWVNSKYVSLGEPLFLVRMSADFYQGVQADRQRAEQGEKKKRPKVELRYFL
jgi:hypothetical protein